MARPGRKRSAGRREPSGRVQRESVAEITSVALAQQRRFYAPGAAELIRDVRIGFALGRWRMLGEAEARAGDEVCRGITEAQFQAGVKFACLEDRWRQAMGVQRLTPKISRYGALVAPILEFYPLEIERIDRECRGARQVVLRYGRKSLEDLRCVLLDERPARERRAREALAALADHFKLG